VRRSGVRSLLGAACLVACLGLPTLSPAGAATVARADGVGGSRLELPLPPGLTASEHAALAQAGAYGSRPVRLLILGDSIAMTLGQGLSVGSASYYGVTVADDATLGCDLDPQLEVLIEGAPGPATPGCENWRVLWPSLVAQQRPQVVALGLGRWEVTDHLLGGQWVHIGEPAWDDHLTAELQSAIAIFQTFGAKVVLLTMPYLDPTDRQPDGLPWPENAPARAQDYNALVRRVARADPREVSVIDLNRMLDPGGVYTATLDGLDVRYDGIHVSAAGGQLLQRQILPQIARIGMADEAAARAHV
jgi:hypothetical protein